MFAGQLNGLVKENFGERFYGVYIDDYKLGYIAHRLSQNKNEVIADFSINMRMPVSLSKEEVEGAKYTFSQTVTRHIFDKKTGFLSQMSETHREKHHVDYNSLLENRHFKEKIWTLTAEYIGNYTYEVVDTSNDETQEGFYKLPILHMVDHFAEINFIHSNPEVGEMRQIGVSDLDFKNGIYSSLSLTLKQKIKIDAVDEEYQYVVYLELDDGDTSILTVDQFGNLIAGEMFGLQVIREAKDQAMALDSKKI